MKCQSDCEKSRLPSRLRLPAPPPPNWFKILRNSDSAASSPPKCRDFAAQPGPRVPSPALIQEPDRVPQYRLREVHVAERDLQTLVSRQLLDRLRRRTAHGEVRAEGVAKGVRPDYQVLRTRFTGFPPPARKRTTYRRQAPGSWRRRLDLTTQARALLGPERWAPAALSSTRKARRSLAAPTPGSFIKVKTLSSRSIIGSPRRHHHHRDPSRRLVGRPQGFRPLAEEHCRRCATS